MDADTDTDTDVGITETSRDNINTFTTSNTSNTLTATIMSQPPPALPIPTVTTTEESPSTMTPSNNPLNSPQLSTSSMSTSNSYVTVSSATTTSNSNNTNNNNNVNSTTKPPTTPQRRKKPKDYLPAKFLSHTIDLKTRENMQLAANVYNNASLCWITASAQFESPARTKLRMLRHISFMQQPPFQPNPDPNDQSAVSAQSPVMGSPVLGSVSTTSPLLMTSNTGITPFAPAPSTSSTTTVTTSSSLSKNRRRRNGNNNNSNSGIGNNAPLVSPVLPSPLLPFVAEATIVANNDETQYYTDDSDDDVDYENEEELEEYLDDLMDDSPFIMDTEESFSRRTQ